MGRWIEGWGREIIAEKTRIRKFIGHADQKNGVTEEAGKRIAGGGDEN